MSTFSAKPADVEKKWVVIDATGLVALDSTVGKLRDAGIVVVLAGLDTVTDKHLHAMVARLHPERVKAVVGVSVPFVTFVPTA